MRYKRLCVIGIIILTVAMSTFIGINYVMDLETELPRLDFVGDISDMETKADIRNISVVYTDKDSKLCGYAKLKVQGTSSLAYDKKNYTITFYKDEAYTQKMNVDMGWGSQNKYCLKANWIDKLHARNIVTARLVTQVQKKYEVLENAPRNGAIDGFPIEIFVNGNFLGLYTLNIPKDEWQFNMDAENENHIVLCGEGWEAANLFLDKPDFDTWSVEVGTENEATLEKAKRLFNFVMDSTDEEFRLNFGEYIDLDAALNYFVLSEFAFLKDNRGKNMLLATYDGELWYPVLYDLDTCWGSDYTGRNLWEYNIKDMNMAKSYLFERMEKNFGKELAERYFELRESLLTKEYVLDMFDTFHNSIPKLTWMKEKLRWGFDIPGYDISQIEEYLDATVENWDHRYSELRANG